MLQPVLGKPTVDETGIPGAYNICGVGSRPRGDGHGGPARSIRPRAVRRTPDDGLAGRRRRRSGSFAGASHRYRPRDQGGAAGGAPAARPVCCRPLALNSRLANPRTHPTKQRARITRRKSVRLDAVFVEDQDLRIDTSRSRRVQQPTPKKHDASGQRIARGYRPKRSLLIVHSVACAAPFALTACPTTSPRALIAIPVAFPPAANDRSWTRAPR
jgi:hypothetical protein